MGRQVQVLKGRAQPCGLPCLPGPLPPPPLPAPGSFLVGSLSFPFGLVWFQENTHLAGGLEHLEQAAAGGQLESAQACLPWPLASLGKQAQ